MDIQGSAVVGGNAPDAVQPDSAAFRGGFLSFPDPVFLRYGQMVFLSGDQKLNRPLRVRVFFRVGSQVVKNAGEGVDIRHSGEIRKAGEIRPA